MAIEVESLLQQDGTNVEELWICFKSQHVNAAVFVL